jgi:hypothetical protein
VKETNHLAKALIGTSLLVLALFGLAYVYPANFWGINFHTYLPPIVPIGILGLVPGGYWWVHRKRFSIPSWAISLAIAALMGLLFILLPIKTQLYGDTVSILKTMGKGGVFADKYDLAGAFSPEIFTTKNGEQFSYSLAAGLSRGLGLEIGTGFRILTAIFGMIYAFVWMEFIQRRIQTTSIRLFAAAMGLTAGATQVFYGHPEVYAAPILFFTVYLVALVRYLERGNGRWFWAVVPLLVLAIRSHSAGFALVPTLVYALAVAWAGKNPRREQWTQWKWAGRVVLGVSLVAGAAGYFLVFKSGDDSISTSSKAGNMFLRLLGDDSPDNSYFMFSKWHLWDYLQEILLCSAPAFTLILAFCLTRGRRDLWKGKPVIAVSIAAVLLFALYFAIDPLLTMPRDWDLFSLIAPPLLVLAVLLLARGESQLQQKWIPQALLLAISGLQFTFVFVNHNPTRVHLRQLDVTRHIFQSGDGGGAFLVRHALDALPGTDRERIQKLEQTLRELAPYLHPSNFADFAYLNQYGGTLAFGQQDYALALRFYAATYKYQPEQVESMEDLAVTEYHLNHFDQSLHYATLAMAAQSKRSSTWVLGFVSALNVGREDLALRIGTDYLRKFGDPDHLGPQIQALQAKMSGGSP